MANFSTNPSPREKLLSYQGALKGFGTTGIILMVLEVLLLALTITLVAYPNPPEQFKTGFTWALFGIAIAIAVVGIIWAIFNIVMVCKAGSAKKEASVGMLRFVFLLLLILFLGCVVADVLATLPQNVQGIPNIFGDYAKWVGLGTTAGQFVVILIAAIFAKVEAKKLNQAN